MEGGEFSSLMKIKLIANIVLLRAVCPGEMMMKQWMKHHHRFQVGGTCPKCQRHFSRCFWGLETYMLNEVWRSSPQRRHLGDVQRPILAAPPPKSSLKGVVMMKQTNPVPRNQGIWHWNVQGQGLNEWGHSKLPIVRICRSTYKAFASNPNALMILCK